MHVCTQLVGHFVNTFNSWYIAFFSGKQIFWIISRLSTQL